MSSLSGGLRNSMRVIHSVPAISNRASGPSYTVVRLCETLIETGQQVILTTLEWSQIDHTQSFIQTFPLGRGPRRLGRSPAMCRWIEDKARNHKVDIFHNHSLWMMPNVYPGMSARRYDIPLLVSPRGTFSQWAFESGTWVKRIFWPLRQKPSLSATSCFHATAFTEYEDIRRIGFRVPVAILPNGVDIPDLVTASPRKCERQTLLFLGRIHPVKGVDLLIRAWAAIQDKFTNWDIHIAGPDNGGYLEQVIRLASELKLKRIVFSGALYGDEKWQAYGNADIYVLPTFSENFGMTVAEALATGTPVIVTKGAPWSGVEIEGAGQWIEIGLDPLVASLENMLERPKKELMYMGQRGRDWMQRDFSWRRIGEKMAETYDWLVIGGHKPDWIIMD